MLFDTRCFFNVRVIIMAYILSCFGVGIQRGGSVAISARDHSSGDLQSRLLPSPPVAAQLVLVAAPLCVSLRRYRVCVQYGEPSSRTYQACYCRRIRGPLHQEGGELAKRAKEVIEEFGYPSMVDTMRITVLMIMLMVSAIDGYPSSLLNSLMNNLARLAASTSPSWCRVPRLRRR